MLWHSLKWMLQLNRLPRFSAKNLSFPFIGEKPHTLWVKLERLAEVHYTEVTSDGRLRHASFKGLREADDADK
ncbi:MAG: hypothetical protein DMG57_22835 [Acidobacteria bacterium]|nr:MAG: hypothetical protein DMG57_22835 [Acidobacteriota bacterium]